MGDKNSSSFTPNGGHPVPGAPDSVVEATTAVETNKAEPRSRLDECPADPDHPNFPIQYHRHPWDLME
jgi:hypothetical protein